MDLFFMIDGISEAEFEEKMKELIATQILRQEEVDFPYLGDSINKLLTGLMNYRASVCTLQSLSLDMNFYSNLRTDPMFFAVTIGEARLLYLQSLTYYFENPQTVRDRYVQLEKIRKLKKYKS